MYVDEPMVKLLVKLLSFRKICSMVWFLSRNRNKNSNFLTEELSALSKGIILWDYNLLFSLVLYYAL